LQDAWLQELARVLAPGGTFSSQQRAAPGSTL
jgi:hypothetical protein